MNDDFTQQAFDYLLGELHPAARSEFEHRLANDRGAREQLKACADSIGRYVSNTTPVENMPSDVSRAALQVVMAAVEEDCPAETAKWVPSWKRAFWPVAAALLLCLNALQFGSRVRESRFPRSVGIKATSLPDSGSRVANSANASTLPTDPSATNPDGDPSYPAGEKNISQELQRLEKLRSDYADLERKRTTLSVEYDRAFRQLAQRASTMKGVGRITSMEMVDAQSYARGERKGLVDLARGLLTRSGLITGEPLPPLAEIEESAPMAPTPPSPPAASSTNAPAPQTRPSNPSPPSSPPVSEEPAAINSSKVNDQPYAWAVFDEIENRSYLNLYNLPSLPKDQTLQIWTKPVDSPTYHLVGEVPAQFYGGSGSVYYAAPGSAQPPADILITQEPRNGTPAQPAGPVILRGP